MGYLSDHLIAHWDMSTAGIVPDLSPGSLRLRTNGTLHLKCNDNLGTSVVVDSVGGHTATYRAGGVAQNTNTGSVAGKINTALRLDGVNEDIRVTTSTALDPLTGDFTCACWIKTSGAGGGADSYDMIFSKESAGSQWKLRIRRADGILSFLFNDGLGGYSVDGATNLYDGAWHHVAGIIRAGIADKIEVWVDAVLEGEYARPKNSIATGGLDLYIGSDAGTGYWFAGDMDDIRVFKGSALSQDDLEALYNDDVGSEEYGGSSGVGVGIVAATDIRCTPLGYGTQYNGTDERTDFWYLPNVRTISLWVNLDTTTEQVIRLSAGNYIHVVAGVVTYVGVAASATYVNGAATTAIAASFWAHLACILSADHDASALSLAYDGANYGALTVDEVMLFDSELTQGQIADLGARQRKGM
jgi:hypothetical protein